MKKKRILICMAFLMLFAYSKAVSAFHQGVSHFNWVSSIKNTYHNLSAVFNAGNTMTGLGSLKVPGTNIAVDYQEVCIYCHTPHASSGAVEAPLWNHTINPGTYLQYKSPTVDVMPPNRPGAVSLSCLGCHDGTIAVPSIVNMAGSGGHIKDRETVSFYYPLLSLTGQSTPTPEVGCLGCHSGIFQAPIRVPDFRTYKIGTDLTNDHPIGMNYPNMPGITAKDPKFNEPDKNNSRTGKNKLWWFNEDGNNYDNDGEIKVWGENATVECASCHNPHGTLRGDNTIIRPFLRKENSGSGLCLTCHIK